MDKYNIVKGYLSGVDWAIVREWDQKAPGRFIASPFILEPGTAQLEKLKKEYKAGNLKAMGEIGAQLHGIPPNDPSLEPYFLLAEDLDWGKEFYLDRIKWSGLTKSVKRSKPSRKHHFCQLNKNEISSITMRFAFYVWMMICHHNPFQTNEFEHKENFQLTNPCGRRPKSTEYVIESTKEEKSNIPIEQATPIHRSQYRQGYQYRTA